jgi:hypothetical protein
VPRVTYVYTYTYTCIYIYICKSDAATQRKLQCTRPIDAIFVPVGGGGLIAGIAAYVKRLRPEIQIIGVEPTGANAMYQSLRGNTKVVLDKVRNLSVSSTRANLRLSPRPGCLQNGPTGRADRANSGRVLGLERAANTRVAPTACVCVWVAPTACVCVWVAPTAYASSIPRRPRPRAKLLMPANARECPRMPVASEVPVPSEATGKGVV